MLCPKLQVDESMRCILCDSSHGNSKIEESINNSGNSYKGQTKNIVCGVSCYNENRFSQIEKLGILASLRRTVWGRTHGCGENEIENQTCQTHVRRIGNARLVFSPPNQTGTKCILPIKFHNYPHKHYFPLQYVRVRRFNH
jgi:hypothetical protein